MSEPDEESSLRNIRPGVVAEVATLAGGESAITRIAPEIAQSIIPVIQTEGPFPQLMVASGEVGLFHFSPLFSLSLVTIFRRLLLCYLKRYIG
jgi:hypothetical protein